MKYIITKHAQQRREHHYITPKEKLIEVLSKIDEMFNLANKEDGIYKIYRKNQVAIIRKEEDKTILITIRGFNLDGELPSGLKIIDANNAFKSGGKRVIRTNYKGKTAKCGYVVDVVGSNKKLLRINWNMKDKYVMPSYPKFGIEFTSDSEVSKFVYYDETIGTYVLNNFERKES